MAQDGACTCHPLYVHVLDSLVGTTSQGDLCHRLVHPRRWCPRTPYTNQESHQVCSRTRKKMSALADYPPSASSSVKSWPSMAWCVSSSTLPSLDSWLIIVPQIMGIVYSSKVVAIEESLLYTRENYFTGSCLSSLLHPLHTNGRRQATHSSGAA